LASASVVLGNGRLSASPSAVAADDDEEAEASFDLAPLADLDAALDASAAMAEKPCGELAWSSSKRFSAADPFLK
jgi:hypothetical protein